MKDTDSFAQTSGGNSKAIPERVHIDIDLEISDLLGKHEITLQFAAFRAIGIPSTSTGVWGRGGQGRSPGGVENEQVSMPTSLYFTYQFYTCLPTRTEMMLLRPDGPRDKLYQVMLCQETGLV